MGFAKQIEHSKNRSRIVHKKIIMIFLFSFRVNFSLQSSVNDVHDAYITCMVFKKQTFVVVVRYAS